MKLPRLSMENHAFTWVMLAMLMLAGVNAFISMPRSEDPNVAPAATTIIVVYPGATPSDMEQLVIDPLEEAINELDDIKKLVSVSDDGLALLTVRFYGGSDPDEKYNDVLQKVNRVRDDLPEDIFSLETVKWAVGNTNIMQIALSGAEEDTPLMKQYAERLKDKLGVIKGINRIKTWATPQREVRISIDLAKTAAWHIPVEQVIAAIQSSNHALPGGHVDLGGRKYNIRTSGRYPDLNAIRNTIIHARGQAPVRLRDIATVHWAQKEPTYSARVNGRRSVFVTFSQKEKTNIFEIREKVRHILDDFRTTLPPTLDMEVVFDQSISVDNRLSVFFNNLFQGMILVGLVIFLAFGLRIALIITLMIPASIVIAMSFVDISGFGLQQMSIVAMVIALGLLVDNAIVVMENILRFRDQGLNRRQAAIQGVTQVGWAVVSSTVTTVLAFVPIIMMQDETGDFIRSMPVTVVYILLASLFLALSVAPLMASRYLPEKAEARPRVLQRLFNRFIENRYNKRLAFALKRPGLTAGLAVMFFLGSLLLFPLVGVGFFPKAERNQFLIEVNTPRGASLAYTDSVAAETEILLAGMPQVATYVTNVGHGNPQIYYNVKSRDESSHYAEIFVQLKSRDKLAMAAVLDTLRRQTARIPGVRIDIREFQQGPEVEAPIALKILGDDLDTLRVMSRRVENIMRNIPGIINIDNPLGEAATDLKVHINRDKAALYGIPVNRIDRMIRLSLTGVKTGTFRDAHAEEYDMTLRLPVQDGRARISDFERIYLTSATGEAIPLKQLARVTFSASPAQISHYQTRRNVTLKADAAPGYSVNKVTRALLDSLKNYPKPSGYSYHAGGELESRQESFGGMGRAALIALVAIFGVLVLQFRSFRQPLIVFSAIPLAITGSIIALLLTGYAFSFTAFVGLTSLIGIVINNSIILVDYANQLRAQGMAVDEALTRAGQTRFTPIILTTATTVGGLLPLTIGGGSLWAPMGWTIIGGLLLSTFLTLLVVPALYKLYNV